MKKYLPILVLCVTVVMAAVFAGCDGTEPVDNKVATPTVSRDDGEAGYEFPPGGGIIRLVCTTEGASIRYTTNGNTPESTSRPYSGGLMIDRDMTIKAIAIKDGMDDSDILTASFTVAGPDANRVAAPTTNRDNGYMFPPDGGNVTLSSATEGAAIYFTINESTPTEASTLYTGSPITITEATTIKAIAIKADMDNSAVLTVSYTIMSPVVYDVLNSMKIGWNLGNTLDGHRSGNPNEIAWQSAITTQTLMDGVAAQGFGVVRIPVTWLNKIGPAPDYTIDAEWLNRVAEIAEYVHVAGMKAIINIHHDGADSSYWLSVKAADLTGANKTAIDEKFAGVWKNIAEKFKNTGDFLIFEAFNELHDGSWGDGTTQQHNRINELNQIFVDTVRAVGGENASRFLVIPGWVTRPSVTVSSLVLPTDTVEDRLIVTIHFYDPYLFTLEASQDTWGSKALPSSSYNWSNEGGIRSTFNSVRNKFVNNGIPVIIGEYGAVNRSGDTFAYQKYYMEYVTKYAHECGFVPILWDNAAAGTGRERSRMFNRATGQPETENTAEILRLMMKAVNEDYLLEDITAP